MSDRQSIAKLKKLITFELILLALITTAMLARGVMAVDNLPADMVDDESGDAIGIKIMPNVNHNSPYSWYKRNAPNQGSPSTMVVDGYDAVRDGRTVYVSAANIEPSDAIEDGTIYTNIYIISYNQDPDPGTTDIFGQLLSFWKFNVVLVANTPQGNCLPASNQICDEKNKCSGSDVCENGVCIRYCLLTSDCNAQQYCTSQKAKLIRDIKRMADFFEINAAIENYQVKNGTYPILKSATYLPGKSISVWPSWKEALGAQINLGKLPVDPVNRLGVCDGFDAVTCWNEKDKKFAADFTDPNILPEGSLAYVYQWKKDDKSFQLCTNYETNYDGLEEANRCDAYYAYNRSIKPVIYFGDDLSQNEGPFEAYFQIDSFYDIKKNGITIEPDPQGTLSKWDGWDFGNHDFLWYSATDDDRIKKITAPNVQLKNVPYAFFSFRVTATDIKGNKGTALAKIRICNPKTCASNSCGQMQDNCGNILVCPDCPDTQPPSYCDQLNHVCVGPQVPIK